MDWLEAVVHTTTFGSDLVSDELMAMNEESKKQPKSTEDLPANDSKTETPHE